MENIEEILAFNIEQLRKNLGWKQEILAEEAKIAKSTVQNYERKERWPEFDKLVALADALKVPTSRLFRDPETKVEPTIAEALNKICLELGFHPPKPIKKTPLQIKAKASRKDNASKLDPTPDTDRTPKNNTSHEKEH